MWGMKEPQIMLSLDDARASAVADVLQNKSCKKVLVFLAEREATETELVRALAMPAATIHYAMQKLIAAGFVDVKQSFWSVKGRKMPSYVVSNKNIIISPKYSSGSGKILATLGLTGLAALGLKLFVPSFSGTISQTTNSAAGTVSVSGVESAKMAAASAPVSPDQLLVASPIPEIWLWFLLGGIFALFIYMILNWRRL